MSERDTAQIQSTTAPRAEAAAELKRRLLEEYMKSQRGRTAPDAAPVSRRPMEKDKNVPMSFSQQQVWLHGQMVGDIPLYNQGITVYRHGPLDAAVLERCLHEIVRRHEIWRTTFDRIGDEPVQIVHEAPQSFPLQVLDLRKLPAAEREKEMLRVATESVRRPMDLKSGPLLRVLLVTLADDQHRLYITLHHLVFDAVTVYRIFLPELET
ncbi:MAG: condensation domain-containing protein, partial [Candidatus Sulfotelmatobacter sp.]